MLVHKYVDRNGSAAMLTAKRSAGVTPEVNLRNMLHAGEEAQVRESTLALKPREDVTRAVQNRGISGYTKKTCILQFFLKKKSRVFAT